MSNDVEAQKTNDGSYTLYSRRYDQSYHNPGGAVEESRHVFFEKSGLLEELREGRPTTILEVGFGTGLNLLLLLDYYLDFNHQQPLTYVSIEADPITADTARNLQHASLLKQSDQLVEIVPDILTNLQPGFNPSHPLSTVSFSLFNGYFDAFPSSHMQADYIFHDAFSPDVNPELWEGETFQKLRSNSSKRAILTTYCAASRAKGAMAWAGWHVAQAPGALGKREMSVAALNPERLGSLKLVNNERLAHRYETGDFD